MPKLAKTVNSTRKITPSQSLNEIQTIVKLHILKYPGSNPLSVSRDMSKNISSKIEKVKSAYNFNKITDLNQMLKFEEIT